MQVGGVQKGEGPGQIDPARVEALVGRSIQQTLATQETEIASLKAALEDNVAVLAETNDELESTRNIAKVLHGALLEVGRFVRRVEEEGWQTVDGPLPDDVEHALAVLSLGTGYPWLVEAAEDAADRPLCPTATATLVCPECKQGKHGNCTQEVIAEDEEGDEIRMVPCPCLTAGHAS